MGLFLAPQTLPFGVAIAVLVAVALIEGVGMLLAASPSSWVENLLPDVDGDGALEQMLGWLHVGKVPMLVLLILFLTGYALFGYSLQMLAHGVVGSFLPAAVAGVIALPAGVATVRSLGALLSHVMPADETTAVSEQTLIGRAGVVSAGTARKELAAQARIRDAHGRTHYLMVLPDIDGEEFPEGTQVLIVGKAGAFWRCIANPHPELL